MRTALIETLGELFSILVGRYFLGTIGGGFRFVWFRFRGRKVTFNELWNDPKDDDGLGANEGFKNRLVALVVLLAFVLVAQSM